MVVAGQAVYNSDNKVGGEKSVWSIVHAYHGPQISYIDASVYVSGPIT